MEMTRNRIPGPVKTVHLIAVCGTAMGALACILKDLGFEVTGSDQKMYPPMSHFLAQRGIPVLEGFDAENIAYGPDLVVVGNAVTKDNPEVKKMQQMGLCFCSMPQAVNQFVAAAKNTILVTGTHGKTTTSSILAWILHQAGYAPSFIIGGILKDFGSNYVLGKGPYLVIEGDEYDTAFFDKGPKFLHYHPLMAVLTSVEFDHADIFKDLNQVKAAFGKLIAGLAPQSTLLAFDGDVNIDGLLTKRQCRIEKYGQGLNSDWRLGTVAVQAPWTVFEVFKKDRIFGTFKTPLLGEHNLLNALAVTAIADRLNIPAAVIGAALESFGGVKRRQEMRGQKRQITVMDDFAHHPTAVRETIRAVKSVYAGRRLVAVFEPRTNSSRRKIFQDVYPASFGLADLVCIRQPPLLDKIPPEERFSSRQLVEDLQKRGQEAHFFPDTEAIIDFLALTARPGDLILIMSNGGFDNIHERLLERL
ncbi:MAG: UDP-N-acetylmuramate:L-alanyl-gamma-D-glutamyl-meso-diaminopimelate ligase [Desulfobacterales bacterium]|nr:MAG: UDP-N-acetylmuramate:L-alanyl-gamma-D-glutamyl-meso-diaminopimelate ligase [Desulfobacterales bacterium]